MSIKHKFQRLPDHLVKFNHNKDPSFFFNQFSICQTIHYYVIIHQLKNKRDKKCAYLYYQRTHSTVTGSVHYDALVKTMIMMLKPRAKVFRIHGKWAAEAGPSGRSVSKDMVSLVWLLHKFSDSVLSES